jgi:hypothetical protein
MTSGYLPSTIDAGDLVAELASMATQAGANTGLWPGLTVYRFTAPAGRRSVRAAARPGRGRVRQQPGVGGARAHAGAPVPAPQSRSPALTGAAMVLPGGASGHCQASLYRQDGW